MPHQTPLSAASLFAYAPSDTAFCGVIVCLCPIRHRVLRRHCLPMPHQILPSVALLFAYAHQTPRPVASLFVYAPSDDAFCGATVCLCPIRHHVLRRHYLPMPHQKPHSAVSLFAYAPLLKCVLRHHCLFAYAPSDIAFCGVTVCLCPIRHRVLRRHCLPMPLC